MTEREEMIAAALRHVDGLTAQLAKPGWNPARAHIEQARNSIQKLADILRTDGVAQGRQEPVTWEDIAMQLYAVDECGFWPEDATPLQLEVYEIRAKAVAALYFSSTDRATSGWTPDQFWEYVGGLAGDFERDQMRAMLAERGLAVRETP